MSYQLIAMLPFHLADRTMQTLSQISTNEGTNKGTNKGTNEGTNEVTLN